MQSKEALNKIIEYIGTHQNKELAEAINKIRQDLDRLKVFEKSSKDFQDRAFNIINTYQKTIEILKNRLELKVDWENTKQFGLQYILESNGGSAINKEIYDLLKEVLGDA